MKVIIFFLLFSQFVYSQIEEREFGVISVDEYDMEIYDKDKDAKAVILYDKGKSIFYKTAKGGYDIRFTRHKRIKIFDKSESSYTEITIPFYVDGFGKTEEVKSIEAITYNKVNGKLIKKELNPAQVYTEKTSELWYNKKFIFPDVQDGSIIEYRYILETPFHFNLPDWTFQDVIPTMYSEYEVRMIPFYEYVFIAQGISKFDYNSSRMDEKSRTWGSVIKSYGTLNGNGVEFKDNIYTYVMKDVVAFQDESYISSVRDYVMKMDFQLAKVNTPGGSKYDYISTWESLNKELLDHKKFGKYVMNSSKLAKSILEEELNVSQLNEMAKAKTIIEYVKNSFEWDRYTSKYASKSAKDFFKSKTGNAADINLFLIALLNEAGINTKPLILSTRRHGKIPIDYPFDHFTNYVVALIDAGSPFIADATEELLPFNKLPLRCKNEKALLVEKVDNPMWINLNNSVLSIEKNIIRMKLDSLSSDLLSKVSIQSTEYKSFDLRSKFRNDKDKIDKYYNEKIGDISVLMAKGYDKVALPYTIYFETEYETEKLGNNIIFKPFLSLPIDDNPLTQEVRSYPVDFVYPFENIYEASIEIPEGYSIPEIPENYTIDNDLAEINLSYTFDSFILAVKGKYKFKKSIYLADEYPKIKKYLDDIVKLFNQFVVIEKKG